MRYPLFLAVATLTVCLLLGGCGTITRNLPRIKIEPPAAQHTESTQAASGPEAAEAADVTPGETTAASAESQTVEPEVVKGTLPKASVGTTNRVVRYVPVGAQRALTTSDLRGLSKWQLDILRNEIYAAHGRTFDRSDLREYFSRKTWYNPDPSFRESRLSSLEKRNAAFIAAYQKGSRSSSSASSSRSSTRRSSSGGGQVLPFSSSRQVTSADLSGLSSWQLDVARNEIYARHGRPFKRSDLRSYFRNQSWYREDPGFKESRLSSLEKRNAEYIRNYQR